jgi:hypothetical protein
MRIPENAVPDMLSIRWRGWLKWLTSEMFLADRHYHSRNQTVPKI